MLLTSILLPRIYKLCIEGLEYKKSPSTYYDVLGHVPHHVQGEKNNYVKIERKKKKVANLEPSRLAI